MNLCYTNSYKKALFPFICKARKMLKCYQLRLQMSAAVCCCCLCCAEISTACTKLLGSRRVTQLGYVLLVVLFVIPVIIITQILTQLNKFINLTPSAVVLRMSLCLFVLFFFLLLIMLCRNKLSQVINQGLFCVKLTALIALFVGSLYLPTGIQGIYGSAAKICSIVYTIIQTIILIDIFYLLGIKLVRRYDQTQSYCAAGVLIGFTLIFQTLAIFLNILAYINYGKDQCGQTTWVSIITSIVLVLLPAVQLLGFNPQNSLFTTALVSLIVSYLSFAGQEYYGDGCQIRLTPLGYSIEVVVSLILFGLTTYGTIMGGFSQNEYENSQPNNQQLIKNAVQIKPISSQQTDSIKEYEEGWGWIRWHFFMCLGVMYLGMVFSNWLSTDQIGRNLRGSLFVFWLKAAASWLTALFYIWTMIVPKLFPERDFRIE